MTLVNQARAERGVALVMVLLLLLLISSLLVGFLVAVTTDTRLRGIDRTRTQAFYAAHAGLEKLTADLGDLFAVNFAPDAADLAAITDDPPALDHIAFEADDGRGYAIEFLEDATGAPAAENRTILSGPFQGFVGLVTPYTMTTTARTLDGSEARLQRTLQTVSIPVFQFGIFSETDLSFFAGPSFNFGGRVHTNGHLFLASGNNNTLTLADRVTVVNEVVRTHLSNGWNTSTNYTGTVRAITAPGSSRALARAEGSLVGTLGSAQNEPTWTNLSIGTYNGNVRNGRTGARRLDLPLITVGAQPIALIQRPVAGEPALVTGQRFFAQASVRILLSDTAEAMLDLPGVSADAPLPLGNLADTPIAGYVVDADRPPLAVSSGSAGDGYRSPAGTPLLGGFLKVEYTPDGETWVDVTLEWLNLGVTRRNIEHPPCTEPNPDAILRFQRVRATPSTFPADHCGMDSTEATDYWPLVLYDTREGAPRDNQPIASANPFLGGVMHYVEFDAGNFTRWLDGAIGASGGGVLNQNGFVVYFSDRRTNRDAAGLETGEYGAEDFVNPASATGAPNGSLDEGEDVNGNGLLETYGATPVLPPGASAPLDAAARPWTAVAPDVAQVNAAVFFRRALKIVNGARGHLPADGITIAAENPAYVEGHFNADSLGFGDPHAAAAIIADAVTLLSVDWNDARSFMHPHNPALRRAATTWYRFATIAGKGRAFPQPGGTAQDFGTDGGVHNFLRYLENWSGQSVNYRGSIASFYFNRQAVGLYKCCTNVYSPPTRGYNFDTDFLDPALLPPRTPMFRDINTTGFTQVTRR